jgi:hypothetical protein
MQPQKMRFFKNKKMEIKWKSITLFRNFWSISAFSLVVDVRPATFRLFWMKYIVYWWFNLILCKKLSLENLKLSCKIGYFIQHFCSKIRWASDSFSVELSMVETVFYMSQVSRNTSKSDSWHVKSDVNIDPWSYQNTSPALSPDIYNKISDV